MTTTSTPVLEPSSGAAAPQAHATRPFLWSVRREIWEHPSVWAAPLIVAAVVLFGFIVGDRDLGRTHRVFMGLDPANQAMMLSAVYAGFAAALVATGAIVGAFYCLAALGGERRDRTILFWKSLPVSDVTAVAAKAAIPLVAIPAFVFVVIIALQILMLISNSVLLLFLGYDPSILWTRLPFDDLTLMLAYGIITGTLWYAPVFGWLLLVSAWAKRASFLWAVGTPLALCLFERIAFGTGYLSRLLGERLSGDSGAFTVTVRHELPRLDPAGFLANPGLWVGLALAVAFLVGAVALRRRQAPI
ncbi:MAG TPA: hypothetical protein VGS12_10660 [Caulobacteraceae bacterium]|nr:hypothetical protein [Caulobacteraceae bacterium]